MEKRGKKIFSLLASVLEFPTDRIMQQVDAAIDALLPVNGSAARHLLSFRRACTTTTLDRLQETYMRTFAPAAACCPNIGHHLFDHDHCRLLFAAKMRNEYLTHVEAGKKDNPDHIAVMLGSLVVQESVEEARELIGCCLVPVVKKMIRVLDAGRNPYRHVLEAVLQTLLIEDRFSPARAVQFAAAR